MSEDVYQGVDVRLAHKAAVELKAALETLVEFPPRDNRSTASGHMKDSPLELSDVRALLLDARRSVRLCEVALRPRRLRPDETRARVEVWRRKGENAGA